MADFLPEPAFDFQFHCSWWSLRKWKESQLTVSNWWLNLYIDKEARWMQFVILGLEIIISGSINK